MKGEQALSEFLESYESGRPPVILSDGLPKGYLPRPILPRLADEQKDPGLSAEQTKKLRDIAFVNLDWFLKNRAQVSENLTLAVLESHGMEPPWREEPVPHNSIDRRTGSVLREGGFYQQPDLFFGEDTTLSVYVKLDGLDPGTFTDMVDVVQKSGYGRDASCGLGGFTFDPSRDFLRYEFPPLPEANAFMALSAFVPSQTDPTIGWWELRTKYGKLSGAYSTGPTQSGAHCPHKKPLLMLSAGSVFQSGERRQWYGRMVKEVHLDPAIRHYGLCYPLEVRLCNGTSTR